jgi:predicted Zn-dependent protease
VHHCVFDPLNDDRHHMARLATMLSADNLVRVALPLAGHPSISFMAETGLLKDACLRVLRDGAALDAAQFFRRRRASAHWHFSLAQLCLARGKYRFGLRAIDAAIRLEPQKAYLHAYRVRLLVRLGQSRAALGWARHALHTFTGEPWMRGELAQLLRHPRQPSAAFAAGK